MIRIKSPFYITPSQKIKKSNLLLTDILCKKKHTILISHNQSAAGELTRISALKSNDSLSQGHIHHMLCIDVDYLTNKKVHEVNKFACISSIRNCVCVCMYMRDYRGGEK